MTPAIFTQPKTEEAKDPSEADRIMQLKIDGDLFARALHRFRSLGRRPSCRDSSGKICPAKEGLDLRLSNQRVFCLDAGSLFMPQRRKCKGHCAGHRLSSKLAGWRHPRPVGTRRTTLVLVHRRSSVIEANISGLKNDPSDEDLSVLLLHIIPASHDHLRLS